MSRFPDNGIISLIGAPPRFELGESTGPDLRLGDLFAGDNWHALAELQLSYGTAAGEPRLRDAIAERHGVGADDVITTVGGIHALFILGLVLCETGAEAVLARPSFPLARNAFEAAGAAVRPLPLRFDEGYHIDFGQLERLLGEHTKVVLLETPQNPSGVAPSSNSLRQVLALMERKCPQAFLVVDETYREAVYGSDAVAPTALAMGERVVVLASLSKCHGAPGLRLGWVITRNLALRKQLILAKFNTVISCSAVDEALALRVLQQDEKSFALRRARLGEGRDATARWVEENGSWVEWVRPNAGAMCCVRLRREAFDQAGVQRFYRSLAEAGARVANGEWFGEEPRIFRLGFGLLALPQLQAALATAGQALQRAVGSHSPVEGPAVFMG